MEMDALERNQVRLILEHESSEHSRLSTEQIRQMYSDHAAKGYLRSGETVKRALAIVEEQASVFVAKAVDEVAAVAQDADAFAMLSSNLTALFRGWQNQINDAATKAATGGGARNQSVHNEANKRFSELQKRVFRELEIHRFTFTKPSNGDLAQMRARIGLPDPASSSQQVARHNGGKPLAKHWDEMWAAIAVQLWTGDLKPETQADVKRAMLEWFTNAEIDIGETAVTQRARQLWQAMERTNG